MSTTGNMEMQDEDQEVGGNNPGRCAACRYLRRRCAHDCVLAPYFPASHAHRYACVHRIFGASNIARLLQSLPVDERGQAAETMAMEAQWRVEDPVYGCTGVINGLQEEILATQCELARTRAQLAIVLAHGDQLQGPAVALPQSQPRRGDGHHDPTGQRQGQGESVPLLDPDEFLDLDGF